jgi:hypothetical protein
MHHVYIAPMLNQPPKPMPNGDRAVVEIEKLSDYCLSPTHLRGRHKARVFQAKLGLTAENARWLEDRLLEAARSANAQLGEKDLHGQRYVLDFEVHAGRLGGDSQQLDHPCKRRFPAADQLLRAMTTDAEHGDGTDPTP